jgi:hypothetical protein
MANAKIPPIINPQEDVAVELERLIRETGTLHDHMGAFRIQVHHTGAFPWDAVFKALLYRDFLVSVSRHKADLFIDAKI